MLLFQQVSFQFLYGTIKRQALKTNNKFQFLQGAVLVIEFQDNNHQCRIKIAGFL